MDTENHIGLRVPALHGLTTETSQKPHEELLVSVRARSSEELQTHPSQIKHLWRFIYIYISVLTFFLQLRDNGAVSSNHGPALKRPQ